jgi:DNA-binding CsgD family transcriptional regulator
VLLEGRQVTEEFGGRSNVVLYDFALGFTGFFAGTWDDALADIATGMERAEQTLTGWRVDVLSVRAMIESQRGQLKDAETDIAAAQSALGGGEPAYRPEWLFLSRALWREAIGDDAGALDVLRDGWNLADAADLPLFYPLLGHHFARLAVAAGAVPDAEKVARTVRGVADNNPGVDRIKALARWCEAIAEGDPDGLAEAASLVGNTARPLDRALAYEDAAAAMGAADRADEARHLVDQAMVIYEGLGASQRGALAAARLRGCGVRLGRRGGRHRPATGWAALTSTELRVASLVGDGLSNGEIAARMFLSRRTVETHVSHILTKVGCTSKRGLASEAVRRRG